MEIHLYKHLEFLFCWQKSELLNSCTQTPWQSLMWKLTLVLNSKLKITCCIYQEEIFKLNVVKLSMLYLQAGEPVDVLFFANFAYRFFFLKVIDANNTPPPFMHPCLILFLNSHLHSLLHQPIFTFHLLIMKLSVPLSTVFLSSEKWFVSGNKEGGIKGPTILTLNIINKSCPFQFKRLINATDTPRHGVDHLSLFFSLHDRIETEHGIVWLYL